MVVAHPVTQVLGDRVLLTLLHLRRQPSMSLRPPNLLLQLLPNRAHARDRDPVLTALVTLTQIIHISRTLNRTNDQYGRRIISLSMTDTRHRRVQDYLRRYTGTVLNH